MGLQEPVTYFLCLRCSVCLLMRRTVCFVTCCVPAVLQLPLGITAGDMVSCHTHVYARSAATYSTCQCIWGRSQSVSQIGKLIVTFGFEPQWDNNYVIKLQYKVTPTPPFTVFSFHKIPVQNLLQLMCSYWATFNFSDEIRGKILHICSSIQ